MEHCNNCNSNSSCGGNGICVSGSNASNTINITNNKARYYAELAERYKNEAQEYRNSAQYYAEQNSDVTLGYVDGLETTIRGLINEKQDSLVSGTNIKTINSANLLGAGDVVVANQALSNLNSAGEARLHALKAYSDKGELLTDKEGLEDVTNYAHSTFDKSKFTVVGSPNITDNGIASGFNHLKYIRVDVSPTNYSTWVLETPIVKLTSYTNEDNGASQGFLGCYNSEQTYALMLRCDNGQLTYRINSSGATISTSDFDFALNKEYQFKIKFTGTQYLIYGKEKGQEYALLDTKNDSNNVNVDYLYLGIPNLNNSYFGLYNGSLDLKYFSFIGDGVPVFLGNKTSIDTIKPDNYTVVGSPTISLDGIATNLNNSSYINFGTFDLTQKFKLTGRVIMNGTPTMNSQFLSLRTEDSTTVTSRGVALYFISTTAIAFAASHSEQTSQYLSFGNRTFVAGDVVDYTIENDLTNITASIKVNGQDYGTPKSVTVADYGLSETTTITTNYFRDNTAIFTDKLDLNAFKIYVDGNLVYQPCLKIPYTESKTGSKIVDSIYRDRVNDMAEQFGYAPYYTLFDTDFTLPQVELYGMMQSCCDGDYVDAPLAIATDAALPASTPNPAYDLSSYLPKDDYNYMVLFTGSIITGTNARDMAALYLFSDLSSQSNTVEVCSAITPVAEYLRAGGSVWLPIGAGREVKIGYVSSNVGTYTLRAIGYRRLGRNK